MSETTLTPQQRRLLAAAAERPEKTIRSVYEQKRQPLASTIAHLTRIAEQLDLPPPPQRLRRTG